MAYPDHMARCRICRQEFVRRAMSHKVCSFECSILYIAAEKKKKEEEEKRSERKSISSRKKALKTRTDYIKEAQTAFNLYVRVRDAGKGCICCGKPLEHGAIGGGYDCGHYRSTGSAPHMRFDELNAHGQTKKCNRWHGGRAVDYRKGLIERIGIDLVEAIEADQTSRKWTIPELIEIRDTYRAMAKAMQRERK